MIGPSTIALIRKPIVWALRHVWKTFRIKDGSALELTCAGDTETSRPEILFVGLRDTGRNCLVQLHLVAINKGLAPIRNLVTRVLLPKRLVADFPWKPTNPASHDTPFKVPFGDKQIVLNFETDLRIAEGAAFPVNLLVKASDWVDVRVGGNRRLDGDFVLADFTEKSTIRIAALHMRVSAHSDNTRPVSRNWEIWLTTAKDWESLEESMVYLGTVQRIWSIGSKVFTFPFRDKIFRYRLAKFQSAALIHLDSDRYAIPSDPAHFFEITHETEFAPVQISRELVVNPGDSGIEFRDWVRDIKKAKPDYYT